MSHDKDPPKPVRAPQAFPISTAKHETTKLRSAATKPDMVCFSHLRWDFVYQRPQHLLSRAAQRWRVFFIEEPVFDDGSMRFEISERGTGVLVVVPHLPDRSHSDVAITLMLRHLIDGLVDTQNIRDAVFWYFTPMALSFSDHLARLLTVYDCMDELSAFKGASPSMVQYELSLFTRADIVFAGGQGLYDAKRVHHQSVFMFPSSIDRAHFAQARTIAIEPEDQSAIPRPRLGFFGVIDERFDVELLDSVARTRADWQFVVIGPILKIDPAILPRHKNIHYFGKKDYEDLPAYIAGWDVALLLFARNQSTRFISPTKTLEYLASGKPVVSTSINDVVRPYGQQGLVRIADAPHDFIQTVAGILSGEKDNANRLERVDKFLEGMSWNQTWSRMAALIDEMILARRTSDFGRRRRGNEGIVETTPNV